MKPLLENRFNHVNKFEITIKHTSHYSKSQITKTAIQEAIREVFDWEGLVVLVKVIYD